MDDLQDYLEHHRSRLLKYLDGQAPATSDDPDVQKYIALVLDEWHERFSDTELPEAEPEERTFWFALYELEDLTEFTPAGRPDPYEAVMMKTLATARERLRDRRPLPSGFMATRPDGT